MAKSIAPLGGGPGWTLIAPAGMERLPQSEEIVL
jgi:hypothetical protein